MADHPAGLASEMVSPCYCSLAWTSAEEIKKQKLIKPLLNQLLACLRRYIDTILGYIVAVGCGREQTTPGLVDKVLPHLVYSLSPFY